MADKVNDEYKEDIIKLIMIELQKLGIDVQKDKSKSLDERTVKADVLLDTMHFLKDYDENVKVLDKYWRAKRRKQKYELDIDDK